MGEQPTVAELRIQFACFRQALDEIAARTPADADRRAFCLTVLDGDETDAGPVALVRRVAEAA